MTPSTSVQPKKSFLEQLPSLTVLGPLIALILIMILFGVLSPRFFTGSNFSVIIQQVMVVGVLRRR